MIFYWILGFTAVLISAFAQILLKIGAIRKNKSSFVESFFNVFTMSGYIMFFIVTIISMYAFSKLPLKASVILLPFGYISVIGSAVFIFREKISKSEIFGIVIIILGICVYLAGK